MGFMWKNIKLAIQGLFLLLLLGLLFMVGYFIWDFRFWAAGSMFFTFVAFAYILMSNFNPDMKIVGGDKPSHLPALCCAGIPKQRHSGYGPSGDE